MSNTACTQSAHALKDCDCISDEAACIDETAVTNNGEFNAVEFSGANFNDNANMAGSKNTKEEKPYLIDKAEQNDKPELSFDEKLARANTLFRHNRAYRPAFLAVLRQCDNEVRELSELEELIEAVPGYKRNKQPPYFPIRWLAEAYALEELYIDNDGNALSAEDIEELSEDEFDDLVAAYAYRSTEIGQIISEKFAPKTRTAALFEKESSRRDIYLQVLRFVQEKKNFGQIEHLIHDQVAAQPATPDGKNPQSSVFIDELEEAGAITFNGGWIITDEGKELLDSIDQA